MYLLRRSIIVTLLFCCFSTEGWGQEVLPSAWRIYVDRVAEDEGDEAVELLLALYDECCEHPVNINDTSGVLLRFPFVSGMHQQALKVYITLYGPLLSMEELYGVTGFDSLMVELLHPVAVASPPSVWEPLTLKEVLKYGHHNLLVGIGGTVEEARGYRDNLYEGDNLRLMWRYAFHYKDRIQLNISGDKDPGEAFFSGSQKQGFDFYGFSLQVNDIAKYRRSQHDDGSTQVHRNSIYLQRVVLGQYHLQFGQGLTLWSGYGPRSTVGAGVWRYAQGVRPNGCFTEYGYMRGGAATLAFGERWTATAFYSNVDRDAICPNAEDADWVTGLYNSGYHRTATEIAHRRQLNEQLFGGHVSYQTERLQIGMTAVATRLDKALIPTANAYNDNFFHGRNNLNVGVDFAWRYRRLLVFGEGAVCANHAFDSVQWNVSPAGLMGIEFAFSNNHRASIHGRYYSPTYHNFHANAIGQNSTPQNESGWGLAYQGRWPWHIAASAQADFYIFPHAKYLVYDASRGQQFLVLLSRPMQHVHGLTLSLRYRYKEQGRNVTPTHQVNGVWILEQTYRHQIQGDMEFARGDWRLVTRVAWAHYHGEATQPEAGWLMYQDVQYKPQTIPLTVTGRLAWFDVDDYDARLYGVESDFIYQRGSTMYQGNGWRFYLLAKYEFFNQLSVGVKYGITLYTDRDFFGSGYEEIAYPWRQQWRVQLRWKF